MAVIQIHPGCIPQTKAMILGIYSQSGPGGEVHADMCASHCFPCWYVPIPDKETRKDEFVSQFEGTAHHGGEGTRWALKTTSHIASASESRSRER